MRAALCYTRVMNQYLMLMRSSCDGQYGGILATGPPHQQMKIVRILTLSFDNINLKVGA